MPPGALRGPSGYFTPIIQGGRRQTCKPQEQLLLPPLLHGGEQLGTGTEPAGARPGAESAGAAAGPAGAGTGIEPAGAGAEATRFWVLTEASGKT